MQIERRPYNGKERDVNSNRQQGAVLVGSEGYQRHWWMTPKLIIDKGRYLWNPSRSTVTWQVLPHIPLSFHLCFFFHETERLGEIYHLSPQFEQHVEQHVEPTSATLVQLWTGIGAARVRGERLLMSFIRHLASSQFFLSIFFLIYINANRNSGCLLYGTWLICIQTPGSYTSGRQDTKSSKGEISLFYEPETNVSKAEKMQSNILSPKYNLFLSMK